MRVVVSLSLSLALIGCVGPTTPFGAFNSWGASRLQDPSSDQPALNERVARIRFTPERQVLHGPSAFGIVIEDPEGVPEDFRFKLLYNGLDVTAQFLRQAELSDLDPMRREIRLSTKFLRLLPSREHQVKVIYWHSKNSSPIVAQYLPPSCSPLANNQMLFVLPDFDPPLPLLQLINQQSAQKRLNPYFVAALVAEESSFNPQALSHSRAMGLTQVTSLGEAEIVKKFAEWPRYPGVSNMPWPLLKLSIINGRIHSGNEWRLDPALSIQGGVEYLSYLSDYWGRPEKHNQIERLLGPSETALGEVMLASYHSGAARVNEALENQGLKWLQDESLEEAKKYVRRVVSYCDHSEHRED